MTKAQNTKTAKPSLPEQVKIPLQNGQTILVNPQTNIIWLYSAEGEIISLNWIPEILGVPNTGKDRLGE